MLQSVVAPQVLARYLRQDHSEALAIYVKFAYTKAMKILYLLLVFCLHAPAFGQSQGYRVISLQTQFKDFWHKAQGLEFEERQKLWDEVVEAGHKPFFESFVWRKDRHEDWRQRKEKRLQTYFSYFETNFKQVLANFEKFEGVVHSQVQRFQQQFPDAKIVIDIYAVPSMGGFNGRVGDSPATPNKTILAFGIDVITQRNDNLDVLFSHELFHVYHTDILNMTESVASKTRLSMPLWLEGIATYVSERLNPSASLADVLMDPKLVPVQVEIPWLAQEYLKVVEQLAWDGDDKTTYYSWFALGKDKLRADLPNRTGYLLGLEVARKLGQRNTLHEMARWDVDQIHAKVVEALRLL